MSAHINLLQSRSDSDVENNDADVDRYRRYEVARSYSTTMTSSSSPHLLLDNNTLSRHFQMQQQQQQLLQQQQQQQHQAYSAYYQSFGKPAGKESRSKTTKISSWLKTKLSRSESNPCRQTTLMRRTIDRPYAEFSYSGANTLLRQQHPDLSTASANGGSLALLLRHKNCPADQRPFGADRLSQRPRPFPQVPFPCCNLGLLSKSLYPIDMR